MWPDDATTLIHLFEHTAAAHAGLPAVTDDERSLSYAQLGARSGVLAQTLRDAGVGRGDRVAIYLNRGVDVLVAMLGVLKTGAAYVAIDTRYPDARRDLMIERSGARIVITRAGLTARLTQPEVAAREDGASPAKVLQWRSQQVTGRVPAATTVTGADMACVIFTSGSSGAPKAIVLEHQGLVNLAYNKALPALGPGDRMGQVASLSFDTFHVESWCSFAGGAELVVLPTMAELIANDLQRELRRRRITAMVPPTMAINHVVHEDRDAFAPLRVLQTGGDVLQPAACRELLSGAFGGEFCNLYGPAEATTACTCHRVADVAPGCDSIPIGRELDGAAVYILDEAMNEVPAGAVGQLYIGGRGVARGYLDQPAMTAKVFLPDPFGPPGARMYATGDLTWRHADGLLEFGGRADDQVKIRGYRVEPREAERTIERHPAVRGAAVIVAGTGDDRRLVALVVLREPLAPGELRMFASAAMPEYLVPASFVPVPMIPSDPHGKRDVAELHKLADGHARRESSWVEPRDETERYLAGLWEQLLAVDRVGLTDDFFALGGNSMLAFRAQRRIKRELGVDVDVERVLDTTELGRLAALIRELQTAVPA